MIKKFFITIIFFVIGVLNAFAQDYLCFTAETAGSTVGIKTYSGTTPDVQYSFDKKNWIVMKSGESVTLSTKGSKVYFKGDNAGGFSTGSSSYTYFTMSGSISASGNVMSLVDIRCEEISIPSSYCFYSLFKNCEVLKSAPKLPATKLAYDCYANMFSGCTSLTTAPQLPATTLSSYCYANMFSGCTSLTAAPELPATKLAYDCYVSMFSGCTSLITAPQLPATTLASECYYSMFSGCTSLIKAPELPATKLADYCYYNMFNGCISLTTAPELSATTLATQCYYNMFNGCSKLNYIKVAFTEWNGANTANWVQGVAPKGTFVCPTELEKKEGNSYVPVGWLGESVDYTNCDYLCFTAETAGSTVGIKTYSGTTPDVQYSFDKKNWIDMKSGESVTLSTKGSKVYFRGNNPGGLSKSDSDYTYFSLSGSISASGNVMSLLDNYGLSTSIPNDYCFFKLFYNCDELQVAPELPATNLANYCYARMFENCSSLKYCPSLPAQQLKEYCYYNMFFNCSSLIYEPVLPKDNLPKSCYGYMFYGCPNINEYWYDSIEQKSDTENSIYLAVDDMISTCKTIVKISPVPAKPYQEIKISIANFDFDSSVIIIYNANGAKVMEIIDVKEENKVYLPQGFYVGVLIDKVNKKQFKIFVN